MVMAVIFFLQWELKMVQGFAIRKTSSWRATSSSDRSWALEKMTTGLLVLRGTQVSDVYELL